MGALIVDLQAGLRTPVVQRRGQRRWGGMFLARLELSVLSALLLHPKGYLQAIESFGMIYASILAMEIVLERCGVHWRGFVFDVAGL